MSQQLLIWNISPFLIRQLETEGLTAFEIFWNADEDFNVESYEEDYDIELSQNLKLNAVTISNEAIAANEREGIEIQGSFAGMVHRLLSGDDTTLYGGLPLDFIVREDIKDGKKCLLVNALLGNRKVRNADDYVASYFSPEETQTISLALAKIGDENLESQIVVNSAEEFIKSELIPFYSSACERGHGVLIAWSI